jgi:beta-galactosidase
VKLASETEIAGLAMKNRGDNCNNGFIKKYRVSVSADGAKWTVVAEGKWQNTPNEQRMVFDKPVKASYIMLTGLSGWNSNALASIAELGVLMKK